ncbi:hypothetical protein ACFQY4_40355 [Catellatospora bangladeshensis]|uniref:DUF3352 domain-containing protein n=1 Tax=Catellatospora bangladeshensis TaxID=310355 RepID=A0A8J3NK74_9ACTN|nr:hypothetical protein [Catellatospora bangladeshensis]GIF83787.1 hypothetical protein Cba03nite_51360 [Catellatospora bangladeshensis]
MADPQAPVDDPSTGAAVSAPETVISLDRDPYADTAPAPARRRPLPLILASVVAVVLLLGVGAYAVYRFAFGDGRRAEELVPASAGLFATIDLETGLEQQLKLFRLAQKAPRADGDGARQRDEALGELLKRIGLDGVDVDRDVLSWLGRRAGIAMWLDGGQPYVLITAASTDSGKAGTGLTRLRDGVKDASLGFVARDGVVLVAIGEKDGQRAADRAFAEAQRAPLAEAQPFAADRAWLEGDQLAVIWADLAAYQEVTTAGLRAGMTEAEQQEVLGGTPKAQGRLIVGVRATGTGLEARYRTFGAQTPAPAAHDAVAKLGALPGDTNVGVVARLPQGLAAQANTVTSPYQAVLGLVMMQAMATATAGEEVDLSALEELENGPTPGPGEPESLGPDLTKAEQKELARLLSKDPEELTEAEARRAEELMGLPEGVLTDQGGLDGPEGAGSMTDPFGMFAALDGAAVSVAARFGQGQDPAVRVTAEARDAAGAGRLADLLGGGLAGPTAGPKGGLTTTTAGNVVTATTAGYTPGSGTLAERPTFQQAVAGAPAGTDLAVYLDLANLLPQDQRERLPFEALAVLQGSDGGDQTGVIRLIMR